MMVPVRESEVFKDHQGRPVFNGAMAVVKVKKIGGEDKQLQRFISNLVPSNSYQAHLPGDDVHLPYLGQLSMLSVHPDEELVVDSEDLTSCFNLFSLPRSWAPYMAFGKPVDGSVFGLARGEQVYPAMAVIPMGWLSAVALTQAIVRHLVFELSGVKFESEVRKTAAFPAEDEFSVIYLDSFDEIRRMEAGLAAVLEGQPSDNHLAFQETCRKLGLPLNDGKRVVAATRGALQGGEIDGRAGTFFLARDKQAQLVGLTAAILEAEKVTEFELRHWTGKVIFGMSFRRPLMSILEAVFMDITRAEMGPIVLSPAAVGEIVAVLALIPLMSMNLRAKLDDEVVVTDASPSGGGAAVATIETQTQLITLGMCAWSVKEPLEIGEDSPAQPTAPCIILLKKKQSIQSDFVRPMQKESTATLRSRVFSTRQKWRAAWSGFVLSWVNPHWGFSKGKLPSMQLVKYWLWSRPWPTPKRGSTCWHWCERRQFEDQMYGCSWRWMRSPMNGLTRLTGGTGKRSCPTRGNRMTISMSWSCKLLS